MYKKIKNGSFMNLFWFIICMLPLIFLLIYAIQFFNTKKYEYNVINNNAIITNDIGNDNVTIKNNYYISENGAYSYMIYNVNTSNYYYLYLSNLSYINNNEESVMLFSYNGTYYDDYVAINLNNFNNNNIYNFTYNKPFDKIDINITYSNDTNFENFNVMLFASNTEITEFTFMNFGNYKNQTITTIDYNLDLNSFLSSIYNSFASNGFINSTLLQVVNYFNVNNVYMQLAILYIEYFVILNLLHLFVDFMLLIPNICHKFMEKVGGERD